MEIDRSLYVTTTLDRYTNGTLAVPRMFGKIALEEAVGTSLWDAYGTLPATEQVSGYLGVPFASVSTGPFLSKGDEREVLT
jgi:hypothetical protein